MEIMHVRGALARLRWRASFSEKSIRGCAWNMWLRANQAARNILAQTSEVNEGPGLVIAQSGG